MVHHTLRNYAGGPERCNTSWACLALASSAALASCGCVNRGEDSESEGTQPSSGEKAQGERI